MGDDEENIVGDMRYLGQVRLFKSVIQFKLKLRKRSNGWLMLIQMESES